MFSLKRLPTQSSVMAHNEAGTVPWACSDNSLHCNGLYCCTNTMLFCHTTLNATAAQSQQPLKSSEGLCPVHATGSDAMINDAGGSQIYSRHCSLYTRLALRPKFPRQRFVFPLDIVLLFPRSPCRHMSNINELFPNRFC